MLTMIDPAGIVADAREDAPLHPAAMRCLRMAANHDHQLANRLHERGHGARQVSQRRLGHLCAMGARSEARAADLAREAR